jgi:hypothetical protein
MDRSMNPPAMMKGSIYMIKTEPKEGGLKMSRNRSTRRIRSGMAILSLLSILVLFTTAIVVQVAHSEPAMKIVLPSGETIASADPAPSGVATQGNPVDQTVGPITRINQPDVEGLCGTGCTQNNPSIAKSSQNVVITYQSSWGLFQTIPTHLGLFSYSIDGGKTFNDGVLLTEQLLNPDQILGPPHVAADGNANFFYAAEYVKSSTGECAIAVGASVNLATSIDFPDPNLTVASAADRFTNPRIAIDRRSGDLYVVYTRIQNGCASLSIPGDPGIGSSIVLQRSTDGGATWSPPTTVLSVIGPDWVDGPDVAVDANTTAAPTGGVFVAWAQSIAGPPATSTISGAVFLPGLGGMTGPFTIGNAIPVFPIAGYSGYNLNVSLPSFPAVAAHPQIPGEYYTVWNNPFGIAGAFGLDSDILFSKTVDGGVNWFTPVRVNDNTVGDLSDQFFPAIAVRTDDGLIKVAFYDRRPVQAGSSPGPLTNVFYAESRDRGITFEPNVKITRSPDDWTAFGADLDPNMGIRIGAAMDADHLYLAWTGGPQGFTGPDVYTTYAENIPVIKKTTGLNFGDVCPGEVKTLTFQIFNTGTADLVVTGMDFTDGSVTQFSIDPDPALPVTIFPDSSATFTGTFTSPADAAGSFSNTLRIFGNDPNTPIDPVTGEHFVTLEVAANVLVPTWTVSATILDFGGAPWDDAANPSNFSKLLPLVVTNTGKCNVEISFVPLTGDFTTNTPINPFILTPGSNAGIDIVFNPVSGGDKTATLTLNAVTPASPGSVNVALKGTGITTSAYLSLPDFGGIPVEDSPINGFSFEDHADKDLQIHNTGFATLRVTNIAVTAGSSDFSIPNPPTFPVDIPNGQTLNVAVRFNPTAGGVRNGTITVTYSDGSSPASVSIAAKGVGLLPVLGVTGPKDFGTLSVTDGTGCGTSEKEDLLYIFNDGQAILNVTSVACVSGNCSDFTVIAPVNFPRNVMPSEIIVVRIKFNPTAAGLRTATIRVSSNAGNMDVPVSGTGLMGIPEHVETSAVFDPTVVGFDHKCFEDKVMTFRNPGTVCLRLDSLSIIDDPTGSYKIVDPPITPTIVMPGGTIIFKVRFNPTVVQRKIEAKVQATTDAGTATKALCGEGVSTGFRLMIFDKNGQLLNGTNGKVTKLWVTSAGFWQSIRINAKESDLGLKKFDGCGIGTDDIQFHYEVGLPPGYNAGGYIQGTFRGVVTFETATNPGKKQTQNFVVKVEECNGFKIIKLQAVK